MARQPSTVDLLPDKVRQQLLELLRNKRVPQKDAVQRINEILATLRAAGDPEVLDETCPRQLSKSAVNRYAVNMEQIGEDLRQSREIADMWIGKIGEAPQGNVGMLAIEIIRTMSFELAMTIKRGGLDAESAPETIKMIKELALTCMRLEKSASDNVRREKEVRQQALEDAAKAASEIAKQAGVSKETVDAIWRDVLRMA
jgi:hypothetical protein